MVSLDRFAGWRTTWRPRLRRWFWDGPPQDAAGTVRAPRKYVLVMLLLVAVAVVVLEFAYAQSPVPPGPDTGKWIATSYAYVGKPYPPPGSFSNPFSYAPLTFPVLGISVLLTRGPLAAGFLYGGLLLALFGLSLIHLARRYIFSGILQVALVGLTMFNGTVVSMLFWGGYPNFLGFVFLNEAMVFLLLFLRSGRFPEAVGLYGSLALLYLTHDLTFAIGLGAVLVGGVILLLHGRLSRRLLLGWPNLAGLALLGVTIAGYIELTRALAIPHPGYLFSNPAAYVIDNVGEVFNPVLIGCPGCLGDNLPIPLALAILLAVPVAVTIVLYAFRRQRVARPMTWPARGNGTGPRFQVVQPYLVDNRVLIASAWLASACLVPAAGWFAHIDTDYTRFGYFFPLPVLLLLILLVEQGALPWLVPVRAGAKPPAARPGVSNGPVAATLAQPVLPARHRFGHRVAFVLSHVAVILVVVILLADLVPLTLRQEASFSGINADANFLDALHWLKFSSTPGAVLTYEGHSAHWVEAVASRDAYFPGPTWIHFYPSQVLRDEQSYWALNARYAVTNNVAVVGYSGTNDTVLGEMPIYAVYVQGVVFPLLRIDPSSLVLDGHYLNSTGRVHDVVLPESQWGTPNVSVVSNATEQAITVTYAPANYTVIETSTLYSAGNAAFNFSVLPHAAHRVDALNLTVRTPLNAAGLLKFGSLQSVGAAGSSFWWNVTGKLGQLPGNYLVPTSGSFSQAPAFAGTSPKRHPASMTLSFANPSPYLPLNFSLSVATPGLSNPATHLPPVLDTLGFLASTQVSFILLPTTVPSGGLYTVQYLQSEYGMPLVYSNSEWDILQV